jgi:Leucine-rich repeat (LRR) protein
MGPRSRLTDSLALVAFYNATDGANWKADRVWDLTKPMDDTDAQWYGVTLDEEGRVTALKLMKGTITAAWTMPAAISELTELTELRFVDCQLTGEFPESLYGLTKLEVLFLTNNNLSGQLSDKISQWKDIEQIYIDQNPDLGGSLPKEIGQLTKLYNLNIAKTAISGTIPAEIKGCAALKNFMAYSTSITGIPDVWDQLPALELIQLYSNKGLTGEIPASMGKCAKIKNIWLYDCNLTGNVPETFANLPTSCIGLRIQDNKLSGTVPAAVKAHANWTRWKADQYIFPQQEGYGLE